MYDGEPLSTAATTTRTYVETAARAARRGSTRLVASTSAGLAW